MVGRPMSLILFDSARATKVEFMPRHPEDVRVYSCGPTEHARKPLAELRPYVVVDVFKRRLRARGHTVRHVIPISDARARATIFQRDLALLGVETPSVWAKASKHTDGEHSLLAREHLGDEIDALTGSVEQIHVRRESERTLAHAFGKEPRVGHWLHTHPVLSHERSGSTLEDLSVDDLVKHRISPRAYRLLLLGTHYRHKLFFSWEALRASAGAYRELAKQVALLSTKPCLQTSDRGAELRRGFEQALDDDLNTPRALGVLWATLAHPLLESSDKRRLVLEMDGLLGLDLADRGALFLAEREQQFLTPPLMNLVEERTRARAAGDFARADALRFELEQLGFCVEDHRDGTRVRHRATLD